MNDETVARLFEPYMHEAIRLAQLSAAGDEVPVGAVIVRSAALLRSATDGLTEPGSKSGEPDLCGQESIIGRGNDRKIELSDPTAHAEILAMREAAQHVGDWRLEDCILVVTLEPCPMCAGAALLGRIPLVVYGARNPKFGAVETQMGLLNHKGWNHQVRTIGGCMEQECAAVLQEYFRRKRQGD